MPDMPIEMRWIEREVTVTGTGLFGDPEDILHRLQVLQYRARVTELDWSEWCDVPLVDVEEVTDAQNG